MASYLDGYNCVASWANLRGFRICNVFVRGDKTGKYEK